MLFLEQITMLKTYIADCNWIHNIMYLYNDVTCFKTAATSNNTHEGIKTIVDVLLQFKIHVYKSQAKRTTQLY